jgi:hypothetical protein
MPNQVDRTKTYKKIRANGKDEVCNKNYRDQREFTQGQVKFEILRTAANIMSSDPSSKK